MTKIALLQMCSGIDPEANLEVIEQAARKAEKQGAMVLFTPEMSVLLDRNRERAAQHINSYAPDDWSEQLRIIAAKSFIDIAVGSMPVRARNGKWANRSFFFRGQGADPVTYDKIHMFDVQLATGEAWRESAAYEPGREVVTVEDTPIGRLGLTVCYDLRFPALFGALGDRRCDAIAVPAAFTKPTGEAHWHVMLRARAIEAQAFVIAAAQVGRHEDGRETYGHSLVVDPWGEVLLDMGGQEPGLALCDIDFGRISEVRRQVPALANRREIPKS
ncbi:carbon-nitrogen hydrolase family protein [Erythrobacter dokdonensis]|jgi:predicted amidohydrolase|uniref:Carbon-nitrogen hydrolase family protein n=1 Tax=Erythrobacter dokdonensis DSW-74 TaxID=1300349 RepID=A0A1A7BLF0_9SPHN|nr:carbon-nitrogen hydrolase family protein [Erythrobacter dokdonensis]MEE4317407.1 carbon-nitrogen hydrolase family protein [Erythrobacter sp.]OBV12551.1 Carbon-nitrogen hydrolase family protein [Erythrobacter dokdonensis DSW-74]